MAGVQEIERLAEGDVGADAVPLRHAVEISRPWLVKLRLRCRCRFFAPEVAESTVERKRAVPMTARPVWDENRLLNPAVSA